jgi:hypothetical protein
MKTNYDSIRSEESRKVIELINHYATKNAKRTKVKRYTYGSISEQCMKDLSTYGIEKD